MKQTEIGMIPDDWEVKKLGELGSFSKGTSISKEESNSGNIPAIRYGELYTHHNNYIKTFYSHISSEVAKKAKQLKKGDLLFTCSGETKEDIGKCVAFISDKEAYAGSDLIILSPNIKIDSTYCGFLLNTDFCVRQKSFYGQGDAVVHISTESIKKVKIPLPPTLAEQQKIAKALSDVDNVISILEKLITKKKNLKQGTMQQLLTGKKRLPVFGPAVVESVETSKFKQTEIGEIPEDWEVKSFEELFDICTSTINIKQINPKLYVGTENMMQNRGGVSNTENELNYLNVREYKTEDILFSNIRPYLKKIWLADYNGGCSSDVLVFRHKNECDNPLFLYMLVSDDRFFQIVNDNAVGTKMPRGDKNIIRQIKFSLPSKPEQTAIANVLSSMDKEIEALNTKLEKYRNLKTGMMQQLLTGKIRLV